jgi:septum formation protein
MFLKSPKIILASRSPRRAALLKQIGLEFQIIPSPVEENFDLPLAPEEFARHHAREKASAVAGAHPDSLVIGADTIVVLNGKILGKPGNEHASRAMLQSLSGHTHTVYTGVSLHWQDQNVEDTFVVATQVTFQHLTPAEIEYYITHYRPFDKAGSYGIQDWFAVCVKEIRGCFYNVVGFPLAEFYRHYKEIVSG